jgi:hypothetical protein
MKFMPTRKYMPMIVQIGNKRDIKQVPIPFFISNIFGDERVDTFVATSQKQMESQLGIAPSEVDSIETPAKSSPHLGILSTSKTPRKYTKNTTDYTEAAVIKNPNSVLPADKTLNDLAPTTNDTSPTRAFGAGDIFRVVLLVAGLLVLAKFFL